MNTSPEKRYVITRELLRAAKLLRKRFDAALNTAGGSVADFMVLDALVREGGLNQRELAGRLSIEGPTLTRHLDHLTRDGWVERRPDATDRRAYRIYITEAGQKMYDGLYPAARQFEMDLIKQFPGSKLPEIGKWLHDLRASLEAGLSPE